MADPTIQTFCCHHVNATDFAVTVMQEFNTDAYNAVCLVSSTLGILGAVYQILPRNIVSSRRRWFPLLTQSGRNIIVWLAIADLMAALGVFIRSAIWINNINVMPSRKMVNDDSSVLFCALFSAWTQYFYTATWIWTFCYALDVRYILNEKQINQAYYHLAAWTIPAILTGSGLSLLYYPDANCHSASSLSVALLRILPNYLATYIPITIVMVANPYIYSTVMRDMEDIVIGHLCQFTAKERHMMDSIKLKFFVINITFYICWLPNLINGILVWTSWFHLPLKLTISIWYIMAMTNPLQALFNCVVYKRWRSGDKVRIPWKSKRSSRDEEEYFDKSRSRTSPEAERERLPLLQSSPTNTINGYKTYND